MFEERSLGVEKIVSWRSRAGIDNPHVLALLPQEPRHTNLGPQRVSVRPDVRRHEESVVRLDQIGQRSPVDAHHGSRLEEKQGQATLP